MSNSTAQLALVSLAWLGTVTGSLAGQAAATSGADTTKSGAPPAAAPAPPPAPALAGFKFTGYAEASYAYANRAAGTAIVGRLYDRFANAFALNALKVAIDRPYASDKWDAGVHADVLVGQNATVLQSSGFSLGSNGDITQLYVTLNVPTANHNGVQFKFGKFVTLLGLEVIEDVANPNWSEGNQFIYVENFTSTGVEADYRFSDRADAEIRVSNGWDRVVANSGHKDFMGRLGLNPGANTSIGLVGFDGADEDNSSAQRYGADLLVNQKVGAVSAWVQADYGKEQANVALPDPTRDATWWALGGWLSTDVAPKLGIALRADYLADLEGARTAAAFGLVGAPAHRLWSGTVTFNVRSWPSVLLRPEVRYDHSNLTPFDGKSAQVSVALSVAYQY